MDTRTISVEGITKIFTAKKRGNLLVTEVVEKVAVNNVSFTVSEGEILGFIGPNGAGKSTTIKMLSGILTPTKGTIRIDGLDPLKDRRKLAYRIGTVFGQKSQLWIHLPPRETFRLLGDIYDIPRKVCDERVAMLADLFELGSLIDRPVRKLSLGERIKCEIAASLLHRPKILFLDEPTIGLDVVIKKTIRDLIEKMNREEKTTIILTSHDIADIEKLCDRVIIINSGTVVFSDTMKNLKYNYLGKKVLALKTENEIDLSVEGVEVLKQKKYVAKVEIDTGKYNIQDVIKRLMEKNTVVDITIDDAPLEEVIGEIYRATGTGIAYDPKAAMAANAGADAGDGV